VTTTGEAFQAKPLNIIHIAGNKPLTFRLPQASTGENKKV